MKKPKKLFISPLSPLFDEFVRFRKASKRWNQTDEITLRAFDKHCAINFPNHKSICEDMLKWCKERPVEHGNSCYRRILVVTKFIEYTNANGHTQVEPPNLPSQKRSTYIPHAFEEEELTRFFAECDRYSLSFDIHKGPNFRTNRLNRMELPVFFRLMFSTGMRTVELRELRRADVDFEHGIININKSKGYGQHRVALHHTTWKLLKLYDIKMDSIMPSRTIFFPNTKDQSRPPRWHDYHFRKIWDAVNITGVRLYDLRSNYAVTNISKWKHLGFTIGEKLIHLSRSMGHCNLNQTYSYFTISPILADKLKDLSEKSFNNLLPKINYDEI